MRIRAGLNESEDIYFNGPLVYWLVYRTVTAKRPDRNRYGPPNVDLVYVVKRQVEVGL